MSQLTVSLGVCPGFIHLELQGPTLHRLRCGESPVTLTLYQIPYQPLARQTDTDTSAKPLSHCCIGNIVPAASHSPSRIKVKCTQRHDFQMKCTPSSGSLHCLGTLPAQEVDKHNIILPATRAAD